MHIEARLAERLGIVSEKSVRKIKSLTDSYCLPSEMPSKIDVNSLLASMQLDKKAVAGELKFILPERIGKVRIQKGIKESLIREALKTN